MMWITDIGIMLFGCSAIWFVGRKEKWRRWGIAVLSLWYTYSWAQGFYNFWIKD